jgi:hypothetical protein
MLTVQFAVTAFHKQFVALCSVYSTHACTIKNTVCVCVCEFLISNVPVATLGFPSAPLGAYLGKGSEGSHWLRAGQSKGYTRLDAALPEIDILRSVIAPKNRDRMTVCQCWCPVQCLIREFKTSNN